MNRITRLLGTAPAERSATPIGGVLAVLVAVPFLLIGQTATSARTPAATVEMPIPPAVLTTAAQAAPPILVSGSMLAQVAEATTTPTRSRYGALLERYRAVVLAYSTQNAQPAAVPTPPGTYAETRQARDEQRTWVALQMINGDHQDYAGADRGGEVDRGVGEPCQNLGTSGKSAAIAASTTASPSAANGYADRNGAGSCVLCAGTRGLRRPRHGALRRRGCRFA